MKGEEAWPGGPRGPLQGLEALQGDPGASSDKLEEPGPHFFRVALHDLPEPFDHGGLGGAVLQSSVGTPVNDVNLADST